MNALRGTGSRLMCGTLLACCLATPAYGQEHFIKTIAPSAGLAVQILTPFDAPATAGANRATVIKVVTNGSGVSYQVQRDLEHTALVEPGGPGKTITVPTDPAQPIVASVLAVAAGASLCPVVADDTVATGYSKVCIIIQYDNDFDFGADGPWQLNVQQHATSEFEYFGWAGTVHNDLDAARASATRPRIEASSEIDFGGVQRAISVDDAPVEAPTVRNIGTAPLSISGQSISNDPAPAAFSVQVFTPTPTVPGATLTSNFGTSEGIWVRARPMELGPRQATWLIQSDGEDATVTLHVTGVTLYAHLLMDCSASMGWLPSGSVTSTENQTRLFAAKEAAKEINNWVTEFTGGQGYFGLSTFPQCGGANVRVPIDRSVNTHGSINVLLGPTAAGGLVPTNNTPMQTGIQAAIADMDARIDNATQQPSAADRPDLRQAILMLSDGDQTSGNAAATIPTLADKGIRMYTIGYGVPGFYGVNHDLLAQLSGGTEGESWDANALNAFELKNAFKNAVRTWLDLEPVIDPTGTIRAGQDRSHTACIDSRAYGVTFVVDWDRPAAGGVGVTLQSPTGEIITPATSGVAFYSGQTFAQYIIRGNRIRGGAGAGEWTLRLTGGQSIPGNVDTNYSYNVLAQTPIRVEPVRRWDLVTGLEHLIEVQLVGWPDDYLNNVVINARYDAPAQSAGTYLATAEVDRSWFFPQRQVAGQPSPLPQLVRKLTRPLIAQQAPSGQQQDARVPTMIMDEPATIAQRKAWALANIANRPFPNERTTGTLRLHDDGTNGDRVAGDGIYSAVAPALRHEGIYRYAFEIATPGGVRQSCVNRDLRLHDMVAVQLTPGLIAEHVTWRRNVGPALFFDPEVAGQVTGAEPASGFTRTAAVFTPMDEHGNHWGPGRANDISFAVTNGEAVSPVVDNWDGTYVQVIEHREGERPAVVITAAGIATSPIELTRERQMNWVWLLIILVVLAIVLLLWKRPWS